MALVLNPLIVGTGINTQHPQQVTTLLVLVLVLVLVLALIPTANAFSHQADTLLRQPLTDFSVTFTYRQPLDLENSSYIGFSAGYHIVRSQDREQTLFDISLFELGLIYYQAISEKVPDIDEYRVVFYSKLNTQFPLGNKRR